MGVGERREAQLGGGRGLFGQNWYSFLSNVFSQFSLGFFLSFVYWPGSFFPRFGESFFFENRKRSTSSTRQKSVSRASDPETVVSTSENNASIILISSCVTICRRAWNCGTLLLLGCHRLQIPFRDRPNGFLIVEWDVAVAKISLPRKRR